MTVTRLLKWGQNSAYRPARIFLKKETQMGMESRSGMRVKIDANVMVEIDMAMKENVRILRESA